MDSWSFICYCSCSITNLNGTIMKNPIAKYLMCAYAYYVEDDPLISDAEFDELAKFIHKNWDAIDHPHKNLIIPNDLLAGTYLGEYPSMIPGAVKSYRKINSL